MLAFTLRGCSLALRLFPFARDGAEGWFGLWNEKFGVKHNGPLGGASGPIVFKSRLLSRDATGGGSSRPEALDDYYITVPFGGCGSAKFATGFGTISSYGKRTLPGMASHPWIQSDEHAAVVLTRDAIVVAVLQLN